MSISTIAYFFLNTGLWAMTWGRYHIPVNIIVMLILLKFVGKFKFMPSILMAFFSKVFASALYIVCILFLVFVIKLQFIPPENLDAGAHINVLLASISLGMIYSIFQSLFFIIINKFYPLNARFTTMIVFVSNTITALIIYKFLEID